MWSRVASTPSETFRVVGKSKTEKVHAGRKRKSTDGAKINRKKAKRERAYQHHNNERNTTHGITGAIIQMKLSLILLSTNSGN